MSNDPTAFAVIGDDSVRTAVAYDDRGELVEAELADGEWDWANACICDPRGIGGFEGYKALRVALDALEANARLGGFRIRRAAA